MSDNPEPQPTPPPPENLPISLAFLAVKSGFLGLVFNPLFRSKIIMQTQGTNSQVHIPFKGVLNTMRRIISEQGFKALWRGSATSMLVASVKFPVRFVTLFTAQQAGQKLKGQSPEKAFWIDTLVLFFSTMAANSIVHPLDVARTKLWTDMTQKNMLQRKYLGLWDCLNKVYQANGMAGLYKGYSLSLTYVFLSLLAYNGIYDGLRPYVIEERPQGEMQHQTEVQKRVGFALGTILMATVLCYPIDTLMQRMIMQADRRDAHYKNVMDCIGKMKSKEGIRIFYGGIAVAFIQGLFSLNQFLLQKEHIGMIITFAKTSSDDDDDED